MLLRTIIIGFFLALGLAGQAHADYWVKAGASGKGRDKNAPMGELWRALSLAKRGDVIRVAAGEYNGAGGLGEFPVQVPNLTLVGGYNEDFSERHPFKHFDYSAPG